jgi:HSP20 family protein
LQVAVHVNAESEVPVKKDVIKGFKGLGELLQMIAPGVESRYDVSVSLGAATPPTLPRLGTIPRAVRRRTGGDDTREPIVDVFDEGDSVVVVVQLPGVEERAAHWSCGDPHHLTIRADSADRRYSKELELPAAVDEQATVSSFANGVLELKLWKRR